MKIKQKAKYIALGAIGMTVAIPVIIKATDAVPITFSQGDILSAEVLNTLFGRLNDVQKGFSSKAELDGAWNCATYSPIQNNDVRCVSDGNLLFKKTGVLTLNATAGTWSYAGAGGNDGIQACGNFASSGNYEVRASKFVLGNGNGSNPIVFGLVKENPYKFSAETGTNFSFIECAKQSQPPTPPTALTGTATGTSVALTWDDQSTDETGFKVQTKTTVGGTWTTLQTTAAGIETYTHTSAATGNNWYRVLATNANGDSITSNEILVEVRR